MSRDENLKDFKNSIKDDINQSFISMVNLLLIKLNP